MRPVNLIPPESRRGRRAPLRSGPLPYIAIGALVAVLVGVTALVLTGNQISESKADITRLEAEDSVAEARVEKLAAFTQFRTLREQRVATVTSLADSRFDWQRVMRELALIVPPDAWLIELNASASADAQIEGGGGGLAPVDPGAGARTHGLRSRAGSGRRFRHRPEGHRRRHPGRGQLLGTRQTRNQKAGAGDASSGTDCRTRNFIAKFEITVAFDAAPVPVSSSGPSLPSATEQAQTTSDENSSEEGSEEESKEG